MRLNLRHGMILAAAASFVLLPAIAQARAHAGFAGFLPGLGCFTESFGSAINSGCPGTASVELPVIVDNTTSSENVAVTWVGYAGSNSNNITCYSQARDADINGFWDSPTKSLTVFGASQEVPLGYVSVPANGTMTLYCGVKANGQLISYHY